MAVDAFLKLEKIDGESQDEKHANEIDILAWSWGMSQSGSLHEGGGGGVGKANVQDLSVTHWVDKSMPNLMKALAQGTHIPTGTLTCRKAGDKSLEFLIVELKDILVTSVSTGGSGGEDRFTVNTTLNFREVELKYQPQNKDGAKDGGEILFKGNMAENKYG